MAFRGRAWMGETYREDATGREFRVFGAELREGAAADSERPEDWLIALELQGGPHSGASFFLSLDEFRRRHTAVHVVFRDDCRCGHMAAVHANHGATTGQPCWIDDCGCTAYQPWA